MMDLQYKQLEDYLISDQIETANKFYNESNNEFKKVFYWELASLFCNNLNKHFDENRLCDEIGEFCLEASIDLCKNNYGNAREVILIYLENSSKFQASEYKFLKFIEILKCILISIPSKQLLYSLELSCDAIYNYIKGIELPKDLNLSENEKQVFDHDLRVDRVLELTSAYIAFLDEFVIRNEGVEIRNHLLSRLINLFDWPFGYLNVEGLNKSCNDLKINTVLDIDQNSDLNTNNTIKTIRTLFKVIIKFNLNLFSVINPDKFSKLEISKVASSVFSYIIYSKHIGLELTRNTSYLPCVYSYIFIFEQVQPLILCLLDQTNELFLLEKGLKLSYRLFTHVTLDAIYIDNTKFIDFYNSLFRLSIYTSFDLIRRLGGNLMNFIFSRFNSVDGRMGFLSYYLNYSLYKRSNDDTFNSYVYSFIIYLFKNELLSFCTSKHVITDNSVLRLFENIYSKVFKLENSVECDLMKNSNKITSTLNLLRFILMAEKLKNSRILELINKTNYLKDLEKAIQLSKAHYELEMKNIKNNCEKLNKKENVEFEIENIKNGDILDGTNKELSHEQKVDAMNISLNTIDLIESLRVRCVELVENLNKNNSN